MSCNAEMCPNWTGHGCICDVMDIDDDDRCAHEWIDTGTNEQCDHCGKERGL